MSYVERSSSSPFDRWLEDSHTLCVKQKFKTTVYYVNSSAFYAKITSQFVHGSGIIGDLC